MGRKLVAKKALEWLTNLPQVEVVGVLTDSHLEDSVTAKYALKAGIPLFTVESALDSMRKGDLVFDIGLSVLFWRKLRDDFLSVPRLGTINFHPAPLPEYKGTAGYNLAVMHNRSEWACSAHYIDSEIDTGAIIDVRSFPIKTGHETAQSLEAKTSDELLLHFKLVVDKAISSKTILDTKPNVGGHYTSRAQMEAMKEVKEGDDVDQKIRAFWFPPYDGAFITIAGKKYTLVNREILESLTPKGASSLFTPSSGK